MYALIGSQILTAIAQATANQDELAFQRNCTGCAQSVALVWKRLLTEYTITVTKFIYWCKRTIERL